MTADRGRGCGQVEVRAGEVPTSSGGWVSVVGPNPDRVGLVLSASPVSGSCISTETLVRVRSTTYPAFSLFVGTGQSVLSLDCASHGPVVSGGWEAEAVVGAEPLYFAETIRMPSACP